MSENGEVAYAEWAIGEPRYCPMCGRRLLTYLWPFCCLGPKVRR
jgi:hypothetical protein